MGWMTLHRFKGQTTQQFFEDQFGGRFRFHASAVVDNVFYAAVENTEREPGVVWGFVALLSWSPRAWYNFGYKDMDETMGPCEAHAPARVLDALTPTSSRTANNWRARCRANLVNDSVRFKVGDVVQLSNALSFTDGSKRDQFRVGKSRSGSLTLTIGTCPVRYPNWQRQVVAYTRDGQRTVTPLGLRADEDAYVRLVVGYANEHRAEAEERYGSWYDLNVNPEARREYQAGIRWEDASQEEAA